MQYNHHVCMQSCCDLRQGYDVQYRPVVEDLSTSMGFLTALRNVLRVHPKGLLALGLPCDSFGFPASSVHQRSEESPLGNQCEPLTQKGNLLAYRAVLIVLVALVRSVVWMLENPGASKCTVLPILKRLLTFDTIRTQTIRWWGSQLLH